MFEEVQNKFTVNQLGFRRSTIIIIIIKKTDMITSIQDNDKCKNKSSRTQNDTFTKIISFIQLRIKFNTNLF